MVWPRWPSGPGWGRPLLALIPLGCVLLGGTTARWSQALMLLVLGGTLLAMPPRRSVGRGINFALGLLIFGSLAAFLPAHCFLVPAWRGAMIDDFGVTLPGTLSPQPFLSAEALVMLTAGLGWFYLMGTIRWTDDERRRAGVIFAGGTVALAATAVALYRAGVHPSTWPSVRGFGPFPNRNQTADFFAIGALPVLACARAAWRGGYKPAALGWLAGWLAVAAAVFHSFSRAGIGLLFATTAVYLGLETIRRTRHQAVSGIVRWRRLAMVASLGLGLGSAFLLFGGETLARLRAGSAMTEGNTMSNALRWSIYTDTTRMIAQSPWCGAGLNTYNEIFGTYRRDAVQSPQRVQHPESDWLWLAAELGGPGWAAMLLGVTLALRRMRPPRHGYDRPLRLAATVGVAGFLAHGLIDVSGHRVGSVFTALFLLGLALPGNGHLAAPVEVAEAQPTGERWLVWIFRGAGLGFVAVGVLWTLAAQGWVLVPGEQGVAALKTVAVAASEDGDFAAAHRALTQALAWAPLDWRTYYMRGAVGVAGRRDRREAMADFRRARYLERVNAGLPLNEARLWAADGQMPQAVSALLEACRRQPADVANFIRSGYAAARRDGDFVDRLDAAAARDPVLTVALMQALEPPDTAGFVGRILQVDPDLQRLSDVQKAQFFAMWALRGEARSLVDNMTKHPGWQKLGWRWWADARARDGTPDALREACGILARNAPRPELPAAAGAPASPEALRRAAGAAIGPMSAWPLYRAQKEAGDWKSAVSTCQQVTTQPNCPAYFFLLEAEAAAEAGDWPTSWAAWQRYLERAKVAG